MDLMHPSFAGGELSPRMPGQTDDPVYQSGCRRLRNMLIVPTGSAARRPGFECIGEVFPATPPEPPECIDCSWPTPY